MGSSGSQRSTFLFKYIEEAYAPVPIIKSAASIIRFVFNYVAK